MDNPRTRQLKPFCQERYNQLIILIATITIFRVFTIYGIFSSYSINYAANTTIDKLTTKMYKSSMDVYTTENYLRNRTQNFFSIDKLTTKMYKSSMDVYTTENYLRNRTQNFFSWFEGDDTKMLLDDADTNGPILDFVIAGFPKCGTTTMIANLGYIAPLPVGDVCTPISQTVFYSYKNWPKEYQGNQTKLKLFRGVKCPMFLESGMLIDLNRKMPKTKLIVGIRHPVLWFQSFWNMQRANRRSNFLNGDPHDFIKPCRHKYKRGCRLTCPNGQLFCVSRARFHVALAKLGKTELSQKERELLSPNDPDGGVNAINSHVRNPIFLYEYEMLNEEYMWSDIGRFLGVNESLQHDKRYAAGGRDRRLVIDFCDDEYDDFRAILMPIAYNVSVWMQDFFIPVAKIENQNNVTIPKPDIFMKLVEDYKFDPCGKLIRKENGIYVLNQSNVKDISF